MAADSAENAPRKQVWNPFRWNLTAQILAGVVCGAAVGALFRNGPIIPGTRGFTTSELGALGDLVIRLLTTLAVPLILFAVLDAFIRNQFTGRQGLRFVSICAMNLAAAILIGLTVMNVFQPGTAWQGRLSQLSAAVADGRSSPAFSRPEEITLSPLKNLDGYVPKNVLSPVLEPNIIGLVLLAVLLGISLRSVRAQQIQTGSTSYRAFEGFVETGYHVLMSALMLVVKAIPFAMFAVVAKVVGTSGLGVFKLVQGYALFLCLGLAVHAFIYYPITAWIFGGRLPLHYLGRSLDAVWTGFSANSSLAAVPVTLRCLTDRMGVSQASARLSACVGTNFNNDGVTLYEAMSVLFVAQAIGIHPSIGGQVTLILASLMASIGVGGVPASGLIILPVVLRSVGMSEDVIGLVFPLMQSVDWILARARSAVNVLGDMQVAIVLDGPRPVRSLEAERNST